MNNYVTILDGVYTPETFIGHKKPTLHWDTLDLNLGEMYQYFYLAGCHFLNTIFSSKKSFELLS